MPLFSFVIATLLSAATLEAHYYKFGVLKTSSSWTTKSGLHTGAFQNVVSSASLSTYLQSSTRSRTSILPQQPRIAKLVTLQNSSGSSEDNNNLDDTKSTFLSTNKASVSFKNNKGNSNSKNSPANISTIDSILLNITSDRTSLLLGMVGIVILLLNRIISFPEDATYEASRSRIDLLGVFAAGSVLLNGITKLDVESVTAEQVALEGVNEGRVVWYNDDFEYNDGNRATVEWTLSSLIKCSPARTAVMLGKIQKEGERWVPLAMTGILPSDTSLRTSLRTNSTPILDRMLRDDGSIKGGTVGGTEVIGSQKKRKGPNESYLPTLQALPGKIEFSYLPSNAQEALLLPVPPSSSTDKVDGCRYAIVLGGDTAKSFAPRDISWCKEIASWLSSEK
jgi:hypothetical protein